MARAPAVADPKDPRFRPFRVAIYTLYFVAIAVFSVLLIRSVVLSLKEMAPPPLEPQATLTVGECASEARRLWDALDAQRRGMADSRPVAHVDERWTDFRTGWLGEYRQAEAHCALDSAQRVELKHAFRLLLKVQDLYTTHAVQYAGEVGPTLDKLKTALNAL